MEFRKECFVNLNIWACDRKHAKHQYCRISDFVGQKPMGTRSISKPSIIFNTDTWYFSRLQEIHMQALVPPPSLSLSLSHSTFANSLNPEDLRRLAKPNLGQTGIPRINHVSEHASKEYNWAVTWDFQQCGMWVKQSLRSACAYAQSDQSLWHEISNNVVCGTSKASDQPAHMHSLIRAFASRFNILWVLSYWLNIVWSL